MHYTSCNACCFLQNCQGESKMRKSIIFINSLVPIFWITFFLCTKFNLFNADYGMLQIFLWFTIPVVMFVYNSFAEKDIKTSVLLYLTATGFQILGIILNWILYSSFIYSDSEGQLVSLLAVGIIISCNIILSLIGIVVKYIIKIKKK